MKSDFGIVGTSEFNFGSLAPPVNDFCRCVLEYTAKVTITATQDPADPITGEMPPLKITSYGDAIKRWMCVSEHKSNHFTITPGENDDDTFGLGGGEMSVFWYTYARCKGCKKKRQEGKKQKNLCNDEGEICFDTMDDSDSTVQDFVEDMWYKSKGGTVRADSTRAIMKNLVRHAFKKCDRKLNCKKMSGCPKDEK